MDISNFQKLGEKTYYRGTLDFVMINLSKNLKVYGYNKFQKNTFEIKPNKIDEWFPDKLGDLHGYSYKLYFFDNPIEVAKIKNEYHSLRFYIFQELVKRQNARYHFEKFIPKARSYEGYNDSYIAETRKYDFGPNRRLTWELEQPVHPILSYVTTKYCAIIPKKPKRTILSYIVSPFDALTWILMLVSLMLGSIIWLLIKKMGLGMGSRSATHFILAIYGMFLSQDIQKSQLSRPHICLYQHFVVAFFILGLFYESLIVSLIFTNRNAQEIKTFEELRAADFKEIYAYENYITSLKNSGSHKSFLERLKKYTIVEINESLLAKNTPLIFTCSVKWKLEKLDISNFYELKDQEFPNYFYFLTWHQNPLIEKIQDHFARIFESGIQGVLQRKYSKLRDRWNRRKNGNEVKRKSGHFYLEFDDLFGLYNILLCGFSLAFLVFLVEWFCYLIRRYLMVKE
jgi:hypothetical protein